MSTAGPELDCRGQRCPLPVIAAWRRMRGQALLGSEPPAFDVRRER